MRVPLFRFALVAFVALGACEAERAPVPGAGRKSAEVSTPSGLVAELTIPDPRGLWAALRKLGGSRVEALPSSFELAFFFAFGFPARVAGFVKPDTPVVGVVLAPPGEPPALVLGVRTVRGGELIQELTRAEGGFRAERDGSDVTLLVGEPSANVLGVVDDWLIATRDIATLRSAARYLARGLGSRRPSDAPLTLVVNRAALGEHAVRAVKAEWTTRRAELEAKGREARAEHGRPADFGDPEAVLGLCDDVHDSLLEFLGSSERLTVTLVPKADRLELLVSLVPQPTGALARYLDALEVGPLAPLLDVPPATRMAVLSRSSEAELSAAAEKPADALRSVLGPRLTEKDAAPVAAALRSIHRGRGSLMVAGFTGPSIFVRQEARDPKELERGFRGLLRMARVPALAEPFESLIGKIQTDVATTKLAGVEGPVVRVGFQKHGFRPQTRELLATVSRGNAIAVVDNKGGDAFVTLITGTGELGSKPEVAKLAEGRPPAALALYADLSLLLVGRGTGWPFETQAPALVVFGKREREASLDVVLSASACAALVALAGTP